VWVVNVRGKKPGKIEVTSGYNVIIYKKLLIMGGKFDRVYRTRKALEGRYPQGDRWSRPTPRTSVPGAFLEVVEKALLTFFLSQRSYSRNHMCVPGFSGVRDLESCPNLEKKG
jgi:hypothetical protein